MHLSRLWTDTQVQSNPLKVKESTSAPVTSVDRHTSTKKQCKADKTLKKGRGVTKRQVKRGRVRVHLSRLWTDTQVQSIKAVSSGNLWTLVTSNRASAEPQSKSNLKRSENKRQTEQKRYECTCHVCGQTHKYSNPKPLRQFTNDQTEQQKEIH